MTRISLEHVAMIRCSNDVIRFVPLLRSGKNGFELIIETVEYASEDVQLWRRNVFIDLFIRWEHIERLPNTAEEIFVFTAFMNIQTRTHTHTRSLLLNDHTI